jgi:hypothetical protein
VSQESPASVRVAWQAVEDADRYTLTFSLLRGEDQEGVCFQSFHTATVSVEAPPGQSSTVSATIPVGSNVPGTVTDMLRAFSTYSVVVEAESDGMNSGLISEPARFTTLSMSELLSCKGWFQ